MAPGEVATAEEVDFGIIKTRSTPRPKRRENRKLSEPFHFRTDKDTGKLLRLYADENDLTIQDIFYAHAKHIAEQQRAIIAGRVDKKLRSAEREGIYANR